MRRTGERRRAWAIFGWPAAIGLASLAALAAGLVGDGGWDVAAAAGLLLPLAAIAIFALGRRSR